MCTPNIHSLWKPLVLLIWFLYSQDLIPPLLILPPSQTVKQDMRTALSLPLNSFSPFLPNDMKTLGQFCLSPIVNGPIEFDFKTTLVFLGIFVAVRQCCLLPFTNLTDRFEVAHWKLLAHTLEPEMAVCIGTLRLTWELDCFPRQHKVIKFPKAV